MNSTQPILLFSALLRLSALFAFPIDLDAQATTTEPIYVKMHAATKLAHKLGATGHGIAVERTEDQDDESLAAANSTAALVTAARFASRFIQPRLRVGEEIKGLGTNTLIAIGRREQHEWLSRYIETNTKLAKHLLKLQCKFMRLKNKPYDAHVKPLLVVDGKRRAHVILAAGRKTADYVSSLMKFESSQILSQPSLVVLPTNRANISVLNSTPYVKDFDTVFSEKGKLQSISPVVDVVHDGVMLDTMCGMVRPGIVGLSTKAMLCELEKPIKQIEVRIKECESSIKLQLPKLKTAEVKAVVEMPLGATVMFELPDTKWPHVLVFINVELIER